VIAYRRGIDIHVRGQGLGARWGRPVAVATRAVPRSVVARSTTITTASTAAAGPPIPFVSTAAPVSVPVTEVAPSAPAPVVSVSIPSVESGPAHVHAGHQTGVGLHYDLSHAAVLDAAAALALVGFQ
jgi:hypothetical protein